MMKWVGRFFRIACWTGIFGTAIFSAQVTRIFADPTDDFSFSLRHAPDFEIYQLMPVSQVAEILSDRIADLSPRRVQRLASHLVGLCQEYRFDPAFVLSLIEVESGFQVRAVSPAGAVGLMQLMPATAVAIAKEWNLARLSPRTVRMRLEDPFLNIELGVAYLAKLRERFQGYPPYYLLAAYNLGPARLQYLLSKNILKPDKTAQYFLKIRRIVPALRFYQRKAQPGPV